MTVRLPSPGYILRVRSSIKDPEKNQDISSETSSETSALKNLSPDSIHLFDASPSDLKKKVRTLKKCIRNDGNDYEAHIDLRNVREAQGGWLNDKRARNNEHRAFDLYTKIYNLPTPRRTILGITV